MKRLLKFVSNEPLEELPSHKKTCPFCSSDEISSIGKSTTLVGQGPGPVTEDNDCNHTWEACTCNHCGEKFTRETKDGNVWYTKDSKVLKGVPSCFESYVYTCRCCGGEVHRKYKCKNSDTSPVILSSGCDKHGVWVNHYRIFFECKGCGKSIQTPSDHWYPGYKKTKRGKLKKGAKRAKKLILGWTIQEEIGVVVINDYSVAKVTIDASSPDNPDR